jgi:RNA polymerase sigma factor (sigma-70 family)
VDDLSFEQVVSMHYQSLYRFAFGLTGQESDAWDLTQQTFYRFATKGRQLQDRSKVKSWLFTTLHREFLNSLRRKGRFPHTDLEEAERELPSVPPDSDKKLDGSLVLEALSKLDEPFRSPLVLFYLEDHSYREIAEILGVPDGTVMSRIARGKALLRQLLADTPAGSPPPGTAPSAKAAAN